MGNYKYILIFVFFTIALTNVIESQTWRTALEPVYKGTFYDTYFVNENVGWAVGYDGGTQNGQNTRSQIAKTTDQGKTWIDQSIFLYRVDLKGLYFFNDQKGFICGSKRRLISTIDGGETWKEDSLIIIPDAKSTNNQIFFIDSLKGWLLSSTSSKSWLLSTTDGGSTWKIDFEAPIQLYRFCFYNENYGILTGKNFNSFYYTTDGITWKNGAKPTFTYPAYSRTDIRSVHMVDENLAYAVGWGYYPGKQPTIIVKTTDGGATWICQDQLEENKTFENLYSVYFKDSENGIAVGGGGPTGSLVLKTSDGGVNWIQRAVPFGATLQRIFMKDDILWVSGSDGFIMNSFDFGESWNLLTKPAGTLRSIQFTSKAVGYASGFNGIFLKTSDGGTTWNTSYAANGFNILNVQDMHFLDDNIGFTAHSYGQVLKTVDGGQTWQAIVQRTSDPAVGSNGVHFFDENFGFVAGTASKNDVILKTIDGGATWDTTTGIAGYSLYDIDFADEKTGAAVGGNVSIIYTSDSGVNWNLSTINNVPSEQAESKINSISFIDQNNAVAVGQKIILKTTDAGATWEHIKTSYGELFSVKFFDENLGYAAGSEELLKTTDQGNTWEDVTDSLFNVSLYSICQDGENNLWIGGNYSTIYTNKSLPVSVDQNSTITNYYLSQNYPNPFNPTTKIIYRLEEPGFVSIKVYDVLGKLVTTLVNKEQISGEHVVDFIADGLTSGIYFYQLNMNGNTISKKMNLIK